MKTIRYMTLFSLLSAALVLPGCIVNDVPLPVSNAAFTAFEVEDQTEVAQIDTKNRTVDLYLAEWTDPRSVVPTAVDYSADALSSVDFSKPVDLSEPIEVTLSLYQNYVWTLRASQSIERSFEVENQIGESVIDSYNRQVVAEVAESSDMSNITITALKLGPERITTTSPAIDRIKDFSSGEQSVTVSYRDQNEEWRIYVSPAQSSVSIKSIDQWARFAYVNVSAASATGVKVSYRKQGTADWTTIDGSAASQSAGVLKFKLAPLTESTTYECYASVGSEKTAQQSFTTQQTATIPNAGFNTWSNVDSRRYMSPYLTEQTKWWDTGNKGSIIAGEVIAAPDYESKVEGDCSAQLSTKFAAVIGIGKLAAGNIFSGEFAGTVGTRGGKVNFGRKFTARPTSLKGSFKYTCGVINKVETNPMGVKLGDHDRGKIYIALGDWDYRKFGGTPDCPVQVNTTETSTLFSPTSDSVIAYGELVRTGSVDDWTTFTIPLVYRSSRQPTHIIIVCSPSSYGDYFTGSTDSVMWVDNFSLGWD